jgi:hypothetical protein
MSDSGIVLVEPDMHHFGAGIDGAHDADLLGPFREVGLVDADGVDPDPKRPPSTSESTDCPVDGA